MATKNYEIKNLWEVNKWHNAVLIVTHTRYGREFFHVSMDIDTKTIKPREIENPFTYQIKRYEDDKIANYTSRPLDYITEEQKNHAEKILNQNLRKLRKMIKNCNHPAFVELEKIAKQTIKSYYSDFTFHDVLFMSELNPEEQFIIAFRESGSYIWKYSDNISSLTYCLKNYDNTFAYWNGKNVSVITGIEALQKMYTFPKFQEK